MHPAPTQNTRLITEAKDLLNIIEATLLKQGKALPALSQPVRTKLTHLREELARAVPFGDEARICQLIKEIDFLFHEHGQHLKELVLKMLPDS